MSLFRSSNFFIICTIFSPIYLTSCQENRPSQEQLPNIILILADDAGYADFGFMGSKDLQTPRLDALAKEGVLLTDAHVSASVCAPSRAGLITGRYQQKFGHECNGIPKNLGLDVQIPTIANYLKEKNYQTAAVGKWHLGLGDQYHPNERGFDQFLGFLAGSRSYFPHAKQDQEGSPRAMLRNKAPFPFKKYLTDLFGDFTVDFIEENKDQAFFIYLAFNAVHTPMEAKQEHLDKFKEHPRKELAAMTWSMDENIGKIIDKLKQEQLYENTLIFFLSDNGGATNNQSSSGPLKGWKGNKYEGGHRVPFIVSWPQQLKGGQKFDGLSSALDLLPTALAAAGLPTNSDLDGVDLIPFLTGTKESDPHETLFWRKDKMAAIRQGSDKLIRLEDYGKRYYNLAHDLGEQKDLSNENSKRTEQLIQSLENWESSLQEPLWVEDENWQKVTYEIHQALMENRDPHFMNPAQMRRYTEKNN